MKNIIDMLKQEYNETQSIAQKKLKAISKALVALGADFLEAPLLGTSSSGQGGTAIQVDLLPDSKLLEQHLMKYKKAKKIGRKASKKRSFLTETKAQIQKREANRRYNKKRKLRLVKQKKSLAHLDTRRLA